MDLHCHRRSLPWRCLLRCPYFADVGLNGAAHPLASTRSRPRKFDNVPPMLRRVEDAEGVLNLSDQEYYVSELGGYPRRIMVVELGDATRGVA